MRDSVRLAAAPANRCHRVHQCIPRGTFGVGRCRVVSGRVLGDAPGRCSCAHMWAAIGLDTSPWHQAFTHPVVWRAQAHLASRRGQSGTVLSVGPVRTAPLTGSAAAVLGSTRPTGAWPAACRSRLASCLCGKPPLACGESRALWGWPRFPYTAAIGSTSASHGARLAWVAVARSERSDAWGCAWSLQLRTCGRPLAGTIARQPLPIRWCAARSCIRPR